MSRVDYSNKDGRFTYSKTTGFSCDEKDMCFKKIGFKSKEITIKNLTTLKIELEPNGK